MHLTLLEDLSKHGLWGSILRVFDSVSLGRGLMVFLFNKFPGEEDGGILGTTLGEPLHLGMKARLLNVGK